MRGDGRIYQPTRDGNKLGTWYVEIWVAGRRRRLTGFRTKADAINVLKAERKRKARGEILSPEAERLTVSDLLDSYLQNLRDRGKKAIHSAELRVELVRKELGRFRAIEVGVSQLEDYRRIRRGQGAGDETIDRDLQLLRAAFRLAFKQERIGRVPYFPISGKDNVRTGFFEPGEAEAVEAKLEGVLAEIFRFARFSGWRIGEILSLRWEWVDRDAREVRLPTSKNGRPRSLFLFGELGKVIERRWAARAYKTKSGTGISAFVFHRRSGRQVPYARLRKAFVDACEAAKVSGRRIHDLRRTAARDLRRAGIGESVCMSITGHATASMFRRYAITDSRDQADALKAREALLQGEPTNFRPTTGISSSSKPAK